MEDEWLKDLRNRMSDFGLDAPEGLWTEIEKSVITEPRMSRGVVLLRLRRVSTAVAAALLILCLLNFYGLFVIKPKFTSGIPLRVGACRGVAITGNDTTGGRFVRAVDVQTVNQIGFSEHKIIPAAAEEVSPDFVVSDSVLPVILDSVSGICVTDSILPLKTEYAGRMDNPDALLASVGHEDDRISVGVFYSVGFNSGMSQKSAGENLVAVGPDNAMWEDSPVLGMLLFNKGKEIKTDIRHRQPLRVGISFSYNINDRIALGTGLTYTSLISDLKSGSRAHYCTGEQRLHYVGLPLNISYNLLTWNRIHLYVSTGLLVEKCVSGNVGYVYVIDGNTIGHYTDDVGMKPVQFSLNAAAGIQFNISNSVGLYAEPGFAYYSKDGSGLQTIYKDKPLNLDFNIGFRFRIGE